MITDKAYDAILRNYYIVKSFGLEHISGDIYSDEKMRFEDGTRVITSPVTYRNAEFAETRNSHYRLEDPSQDIPPFVVEEKHD